MKRIKFLEEDKVLKQGDLRGQVDQSFQYHIADLMWVLFGTDERQWLLLNRHSDFTIRVQTFIHQVWASPSIVCISLFFVFLKGELTFDIYLFAINVSSVA